MLNQYTENFNSIPIFDLQNYVTSDKKIRENFINQLRDVCHHIGFFYIKNHGISSDEIKHILQLTKLFFDLPQEEKNKIHIGSSPHFRGYGELGAEFTEGKADFKETLDLGLEVISTHVPPEKSYLVLRGPNQWPTDKSLIEMKWKEHILSYIAKLQKIGEQLIGAMSLALGFSEHFLKNQFCADSDDAYAMLRLLKYPPCKGDQPELGVGTHVDSGCLIILLQDEIGGLQVQNCKGEWIDATPIPDTFVVNIGRMLQIWSNNYFLATPHRVINSSKKTRYSIPFFFEPNLSTSVTPLKIAPELLSPKDQIQMEPVVYGEYMLKVYQRSFPSTQEMKKSC